MAKGTYTEQRRAKAIQQWAAIDVGTRVQMHPATDAWMCGDRYGEIAKLGDKFVHVKMDRSRQTLMVSPDNLIYLD